MGVSTSFAHNMDEFLSLEKSHGIKILSKEETVSIKSSTKYPSILATPKRQQNSEKMLMIFLISKQQKIQKPFMILQF
jgi:hypothetical protein